MHSKFWLRSSMSSLSCDTSCPRQQPSLATLTYSISALSLRESTEGPDMCGFMPRLDLGATNFQSSVQSVGASDLGSLQARGLYFFGCQHCNHQMTFSPLPEKYSQLGGAVFGGRWLAVDRLV